jgi:hypothetical protein
MSRSVQWLVDLTDNGVGWLNEWVGCSASWLVGWLVGWLVDPAVDVEDDRRDGGLAPLFPCSL